MIEGTNIPLKISPDRLPVPSIFQQQKMFEKAFRELKNLIMFILENCLLYGVYIKSHNVILIETY